MKKILLLVAFLLVGCTTSPSSGPVYNVNNDYFLFSKGDSLVYKSPQSGNWFVYNLKDETTMLLSRKSTVLLKETSSKFNNRAIPLNDKTLFFEPDMQSGKWAIYDIPDNTKIPNLIVDFNSDSLIDPKFTNQFILKDGSKMNEFDAFLNTLEPISYSNSIPYNNYLYFTSFSSLIRSNYYGKKLETLPVELNVDNPNLVFKGEDIYYLNSKNTIMVYNHNSKTNQKIMEDVLNFHIDEDQLFFSKLADLSYNHIDLNTNKSTHLADVYSRDMCSDLIHVYYFSDRSTMEILRMNIETKAIETITDEGLYFRLIEDKVIIVKSDGTITAIDK